MRIKEQQEKRKRNHTDTNIGVLRSISQLSTRTSARALIKEIKERGGIARGAFREPRSAAGFTCLKAGLTHLLAVGKVTQGTVARALARVQGLERRRGASQ